MQEGVRKALARVPAIEETTPTPAEIKERAAAARKYVLPEFAATLTRLEALESPTERRVEWDQFLAAFRSFVSSSDENLATVEGTGDVALFERALEERENLVDELTSAAIRARAPRCAPT
jgi:hypothetical protein